MEDAHAKTLRIIQNLSEDESLRYHHELVLYARSCCSKWSWRSGRQNLPGGYKEEAIANEAVKRLMVNERTWNHEKFPEETDLLYVLKGIVKSLIYNLGHSSDHKTSVSLEDVSAAENADGEQYTQTPEAMSSGDGFCLPPQSSSEEKIFADEMKLLMERELADRPDVLQVYKLRCEGYKPREIALEMQLEEKQQVYPLLRLLARRADKVWEEYVNKR